MLNAIFKHVEIKEFFRTCLSGTAKNNFTDKYQNKFENCTFITYRFYIGSELNQCSYYSDCLKGTNTLAIHYLSINKNV
jgi:hypothetical protein